MPEQIAISARWILPASGPPVERGILVLEDGKVGAILPHGSRRADVAFADAAIVPGFVNAHTHLDLCGAQGLMPPSDDYIGWLRQVIAFRRATTPDDVQAGISVGLQECLRYGTTLVGDISGDGSSWRPMAESGLRAVVFRELIGLPKDRAEQSWQSAQSWLGDCVSTAKCRPGFSPHAPYSARVSLIKAAAHADVPCAIHLAEFAGERELLEEHDGPFVQFLHDVGAWEPLGLAKGPEHVLRQLEGTAPTVAVHANYLAESAAIPGNVSLVYCPRTQAAFEHPPFPLSRWLKRGVNVALGTDSLASSPDLNMLAEMRFVREQHPELDGAAVLRLGTQAGAAALGRNDECGSLEPGNAADFVVISAPAGDDPHDAILAENADVCETWIAGRRVWP